MLARPSTFQPAPAFLRYRFFLLSWGVAGFLLAIVWLPLLGLGLPGAAPALNTITVAWVTLVTAAAVCEALYIPRHTRSLSYRLEDERLVAEGGIWFKVRTHIPYGRITDVRILQGPVERRYGVSRLFIQTAGSPGAEAVLLGITDPDEVRADLMERKARAIGDGSEAMEATGVLDELRAIRSELVEIRKGLGK